MKSNTYDFKLAERHSKHYAKFFFIGTRSIKHSDTDFPLHLLMIILFLTLIILSLFTYCLKICENMFCRHSGPDSGESSSEGGDNHCMRWKFAVSLHCCCCQWKVGRVSVQGVKSLWGDCRFIPADWGS